MQDCSHAEIKDEGELSGHLLLAGIARASGMGVACGYAKAAVTSRSILTVGVLCNLSNGTATLSQILIDYDCPLWNDSNPVIDCVRLS
jgi:hypothetical protein